MASPAGDVEPTLSGPPSGGAQYNTNQADLNEDLFQLEDDEREFVTNQTGINDPEELKKHVLQVQKEIYAVSSVQCVILLAKSLDR